LEDNYLEKLECIKCKKTIAYYQRAMNRDGVVDADEMEEYLLTELAGYYAELNNLICMKNAAESANEISHYQTAQAKKIYRRLAKLLHPDMHPKTAKNAVLRELWTRIVNAYKLYDVKALRELEVQVQSALSDLGLESVPVEIPDISEKLEEVKKEIREIIETEPYILRELLENEGAAEAKERELKEELEEFRKYHAELDEVIREIRESGRVTIRMEWNPSEE